MNIIGDACNNDFYERTLKEAEKQLEIIEARIQEELVRARRVIGDLQQRKQAVKRIYDGAASVLGAGADHETAAVV